MRWVWRNSGMKFIAGGKGETLSKIYPDSVLSTSKPTWSGEDTNSGLLRWEAMEPFLYWVNCPSLWQCLVESLASKPELRIRFPVGSGSLMSILRLVFVMSVFYPVLTLAVTLTFCWPQIQGGPPLCTCLELWSSFSNLCHFTYVTAHSPTLLSLLLHHKFFT